MTKSRRWIGLGFTALLGGCGSDRSPADASRPDGASPALPNYTEEREPCQDRNPLRNAYFGDLHIHTIFSFDAYLWQTRAGPAEAYAFARGESIDLPPLDADGQPTRTARLERPLDFAAVTDHAEFLGEVRSCLEPDLMGYDSAFCSQFRDNAVEALVTLGAQLLQAVPERQPEVCTADDCDAVARTAWQRIQAATEAAYDRTSACEFTALHGYEWSANTAGNNLHRNVLFRNDAVPADPVSYYDATTPEQLWASLDRACERAGEQCQALAIPHNSNLSNGAMFAPLYPGAQNLQDERRQAALRARLEPLVEIFQHKGNSECLPSVSGIIGEPDELCAIEEIRSPVASDCGDEIGANGIVNQGCVSRYDFVRNVLLLGLSEEERLGVNPYRLGVIASTDTHSATGGATDEATYEGHIGAVEATVLGRLGDGFAQPSGFIGNPGGLAGVWAVENSRDAIFEALASRETFGTTGPRIAPRFFGGWQLPETVCGEPNMLEIAYDEAVPMGGTLAPRPPDAGAPTFLAAALRDPSGENAVLERLQVVKGWVGPDGALEYRVYDVAGDRESSATVDLLTCERRGDGFDSLCALWSDPSFDATRPAFYYMRAVETPSCRWSHRQCLALAEAERPENCQRNTPPRTIQELAWSSPIWYSPESD